MLFRSADQVQPLDNEFLNGYQFSNFAKSKSIAKWGEEIEKANTMLTNAKSLHKAKEWLESNEGKEYQQSLADKRKTLQQQRKQLYTETSAYLKGVISVVVGNGWDIINLSSDSVQIGYIEEYIDNRPSAYFGYTINLSIGREGWDKPKDELKISYSSLGDKEIINDDAYRSYVIGMGKLVESKHTLKLIKNKMMQYFIDEENINGEIYKIDYEIKNPKIPKEWQ